MQRRRWIVWAVVSCTIVALAVIARRNIEMVGDREAIAGHLQALKAEVERNPADSRALDEIRGVLNGRWSFARTYSCGVLGELGPKARPAIPDLIQALDCGDAFVEREAARALGEIAIGDPEPVPALAKKLSLESRDVAWFSAEALGNIGAPALSAIPELEKAAMSSNESTANRARKALVKLRKLQPDR